MGHQEIGGPSFLGGMMYEWKRESERTCVDAWGMSMRQAEEWVGNVTMYSQIDKHKRELLEKEKAKFHDLVRDMKESFSYTQLPDETWDALANYCRKHGRKQFEKGRIEGTDYSECRFF